MCRAPSRTPTDKGTTEEQCLPAGTDVHGPCINKTHKSCAKSGISGATHQATAMENNKPELDPSVQMRPTCCSDHLRPTALPPPLLRPHTTREQPTCAQSTCCPWLWSPAKSFRQTYDFHSKTLPVLQAVHCLSPASPHQLPATCPSSSCSSRCTANRLQLLAALHCCALLLLVTCSFTGSCSRPGCAGAVPAA